MTTVCSCFSQSGFSPVPLQSLNTSTANPPSWTAAGTVHDLPSPTSQCRFESEHVGLHDGLAFVQGDMPATGFRLVAGPDETDRTGAADCR